MNFYKPTGCGIILNFIQIDCKIFENLDTGFSPSPPPPTPFPHTTVSLNEGQGHPNEIKMYNLVIPIIIPSSNKKNGLSMSEY